MKKNLSILFLFVMFLSCNNNVKSTKESSDNSFQKKHILEKVLKDSLKKVEQNKIDSINKEEDLRIIGNIRFGMNKSDFKRSSLDFMNKCKSKKTEYNYELYPDYTKKSTYKIGDYEYSSIYDSYYNDNYLYLVTISGVYIKTDYYKTKMKEQVSSLYSVLETKYGKATENFGFPEWYSIGTDETKELAYWHIRDKLIKIKIHSFGDCYSLDLDIFSLKINKTLKLEEEQNNKDKAKKGAEIL